MTYKLRYHQNPPVPVDSNDPLEAEELIEKIIDQRFMYLKPYDNNCITTPSCTLDGKWEYEVVASVIEDKLPKLFICDTLFIKLEVDVTYEINSDRSQLFIIADVYRTKEKKEGETTFVEEEAVAYEIYSEFSAWEKGWMTSDKVKELIEYHVQNMFTGIIFYNRNLLKW